MRYESNDMHTLVLEGEIFRLPKKYTIERVMGKGSYGVVCAGKNIETNEPVAIKKNKGIFPCSNPNEFDTATKQPTHYRSVLSQKRILRELKILIHLRHENIISLLDVIEPESYDQFGDVYFITDLMEADLRDILDSHQELSDQHIQYFMYQLVKGVQHMHSASVLHRDLKPENILVKADCSLKLCDLGLARGMDFENDPKMSTNYVQTRWYRAPELLLDNECVSNETDVWSVGCIFAELLNRKIMFRGVNPSDQLRQIIKKLGTPSESDIKGSQQGKAFLRQLPKCPAQDFRLLFPNVSSEAIDLLQKLLTFNFEKRISAREALCHPYFASIHDDSLITSAPTFDFGYESDMAGVSDNSGIKREAYNTIMSFNGHSNVQAINGDVKPGHPTAVKSNPPGAFKTQETTQKAKSKTKDRPLSQSGLEKRLSYNESRAKTAAPSVKKQSEDTKSVGFLKRVRSVLKKL
ncbi:mitogen-activated protein kinase [Acrasis kona]|uniref:Mitogen-activated protein kinase n=1 Tax=Acrasis kona TaxID=1008807 RepID=A0AAW2YWC9_9EUKA